MANMHVLTWSGNAYKIARHIAIPAGNNAAGFPWNTIVIRAGIGGKTILPDGDGTGGTISAAEKAQVLSGDVLEQVVSVVVPEGLAGQAILDLLNADHTQNSAALLTELSLRLNQYGRNV